MSGPLRPNVMRSSAAVAVLCLASPVLTTEPESWTGPEHLRLAPDRQRVYVRAELPGREQLQAVEELKAIRRKRLAK